MKFIPINSLLVLIPLASSGAVIINPDFELVSGYSTFSSPNSFSGWTVSAGTAGLPLSSLGTPKSGNQVLVPAFTASAGTSTVNQNITGLSINTTYELSFWSSVYSSSTYYGSSSAVVSIGSATTNFFYDIPAESRTFGSSNSPWVARSILFTPKAAAEDLTISVTHSSFDPYIGFDNFSLKVVPEPSTHFLFLTASVSWMLRRSRTRR